MTNPNQFSDLGPSSEVLGAESQLEAMLSARRAIKALNTLEALPMNKRVEKCRELFDRVFRVYADTLEGRLGLGKLETPDRPRYVAIQSLCLAMFATAETGGRDILAREFLALDELRKRLENLIADNKAACSEAARKAGCPDLEMCKSDMLEACAPDRRFRVNVLRLAVARDPHAPDNLLTQIDAYCRGTGMTATELRIVPWNARTTCFEGSPLDTSKGVTKYSFYDCGGAASLEMFDGKAPLKREILEEVRKLALRDTLEKKQ
jgi:hypothetical protein